MRRLLILLTFLIAGTALAAAPLGFVFAEEPTVHSYDATNSRGSYNSTGGKIHVTRTLPGLYRVVFIGLGPENGPAAGHRVNIQVDAVNGSRTCNELMLSGHENLIIDVNCYDLADGSAHDSKFRILVTFSP
jgi:hypothetical protein